MRHSSEDTDSSSSKPYNYQVDGQLSSALRYPNRPPADVRLGSDSVPILSRWYDQIWYKTEL